MRAAFALALLATLTACAGGPVTRDDVYDRVLKGRADPSAVVATELAFARAAQERGQWTAFAEYATDDAMMFVPEPVNAKGWLKGRANPSQAIQWQPHQVWSSCDGSLAVTKGAWQRPDGSTGYFTTVWQRQGDGTYRWVLDQADQLAQPLAAPDFIGTQVADCRKPGSAPAPVAIADYPEGTREAGGTATDGSLRWHWVVMADGRRAFDTAMFVDGEWRQVVKSEVEPQAR